MTSDCHRIHATIIRLLTFGERPVVKLVMKPSTSVALPERMFWFSRKT